MLFRSLEQHRKLVDSLHKNTPAVVPVERVMAFVHAVTNRVLEVIPDARSLSTKPTTSGSPNLERV